MTPRALFPVAMIAAGLISGCATNPQVLYQPATGPDEGGAVKFKLTHSVIKFDTVKAATSDGTATGTKPAAGAVSGYTITSVPVSAKADPVYSVVGTGVMSNWGVSTLLTVKLRPDSDLIQQIAVKATDQRITIIQGVTGLVAAAIPLLAAEGQGAAPAPPSQIDVSSQLSLADKDCKPAKAGDSDGAITCTKSITTKETTWVVTIDYGPVPSDAFGAAVLNAKYISNSFVYAACRDATVTLYNVDNGNNVSTLPSPPYPAIALPSATVKVADPRYLQSLAMPFSGTVAAADSCGAASTPDNSASASSALDVANALLKGAQSIKDAADKKSGAAATPAATTPAKKT